ncbi:choice-of-anchor B family protein, partial [bacterium]|nr:choice-of-anchor B family protein [bacterium]
MGIGAQLKAQEPFALDLVGRWTDDSLPAYKDQIFNDLWGWEDGNGREYVILGSIDSTYFIEVTFPEKPVVRDVVAGRATNCVHRDFKTYRNYCYGVADEGNSSLQIFDLSYLPDSVHLFYDSDKWTRRAHNIFIANNKAFLASNLHPQYGFIPMTVLDLERNPRDPYAIFHLQSPEVDGNKIFSHVHDVYVRHNIAYCSNGYSGLFVYDAGNRGNGLQFITSLPKYIYQGYNHSSWLNAEGNLMAMADETFGMPLKMVDISDSTDYKVISAFGSQWQLGSIPHNPFILGDKCFVSYYHDGLVVFDISDPENVVVADQYDTYPDNDSLD